MARNPTAPNSSKDQPQTPPIFVLPREVLHLDQKPTADPLLTLDVIWMLMAPAREHLCGPTRGSFVITFQGDIPKHTHFSTYEPEPTDNSDFARDARRKIRNYAVGYNLPVVLCRPDPSFVGITLVPLPWAEQKPYCALCGALTPTGVPHKCGASE